MIHIKRIDEMFSKHNINEGAGAGYTITLDGLELDKNSVKIISDEMKYDSNDKYGYKHNLKCVMWEANIKPSVLEKWSAIGYYDGIDSDEFDTDDKRVNGGIVRGYVDIGSVMDWTEDTKYTKNDVISFIQSCIDNTEEIKIEVMYGAGWVHCNLTDPIVLGEDVKGENINLRNIFDEELFVLEPEVLFNSRYNEKMINGDLTVITYASIDAPNITDNVNYFFENL